MAGDVSRRTFMAAAGASMLAHKAAWAQESTRFRIFWWGSKERADRTMKAAALYQQRNPHIKIDGESLSFTDYWPRLATQVAGRNAPDLIQMDYRYLAEYARRGVLLPLDEYVGKDLQIGDFGQASLDSCKVDGKLYAINLGNNSHALIYNKAAFQKAGVDEPVIGTSWDKFAAICAEVTKAHDGSYFGTVDAGADEAAFENWLRQRSKALYTEDGKLGFGEADVGDWLSLWVKMREVKACPPADIQALDKSGPDTSLLTQGRAGCAFNHSNQFVGFQAINKNTLGIATYPQGAGPNPGQYLKPSMMWSVYARSKVAPEAVKFANFTVKDPEGARILGVERGVPPSPATRQVVSDQLDEMSRKVVDFIAEVSQRVGPIPPAPPQGAGEIQVLLRRVNEQVGFGRANASAAAKQYIAEANTILSRVR
jgi:multiple sugar transport system substrate-binding protein